MNTKKGEGCESHLFSWNAEKKENLGVGGRVKGEERGISSCSLSARGSARFEGNGGRDESDTSSSGV